MIKEDFSKRVIDYYDSEINIQEFINGMLSGSIRGFSACFNTVYYG